MIGPISEAGLDKEFAKGVASGKPIISTVNPVAKSTVTSKMTVDFDTMGEQTGNYLVDYLKAKVGESWHLPRSVRLRMGGSIPRRLQEGSQGQEQHHHAR